MSNVPDCCEDGAAHIEWMTSKGEEGFDKNAGWWMHGFALFACDAEAVKVSYCPFCGHPLPMLPT